MKDKIVSLIRLQYFDNRIKEINIKKKQGPQRIKELEAELNSHEERYSGAKNKLEILKKERHAIENDVQDIDRKIEKSQIKLNNIKSNKEYRSALKEIDDLNREKSIKEDRLIQIMEEVEDLETKIRQNNGEYEGLKEKFNRDKDSIEKDLVDLVRESGILENKREIFVQEVDQDLLRTYLFLRDKKGGQAMSAIKSGVCQSCHIGIPPQQFIELQKCGSLLNCPHCNRIIYWADDEFFRDAIHTLEQDG